MTDTESNARPSALREVFSAHRRIAVVGIAAWMLMLLQIACAFLVNPWPSGKAPSTFRIIVNEEQLIAYWLHQPIPVETHDVFDPSDWTSRLPRRTLIDALGVRLADVPALVPIDRQMSYYGQAYRLEVSPIYIYAVLAIAQLPLLVLLLKAVAADRRVARSCTHGRVGNRSGTATDTTPWHPVCET